MKSKNMLTLSDKMKFLNPLAINQMSKIYTGYPGPYAIDETDLDKIFPGINKHTKEIELPYVHGDLPPQNLNFIHQMVSYLKPKTILEIGTYRGRTTLTMAKANPSSNIITIDVLKEDAIAFSGNDEQYLQKEEEIGIFYKESKYKNQIKQIYSGSENCIQELDYLLGNQKIDLAFIDGNHMFGFMENDFESVVLPRLKLGGVAIFDDYNRLYTVVGSTHYLTHKAYNDGYIFYWYAPRETKNTNEVIFLNIPECIGNDWRKMK